MALTINLNFNSTALAAPQSFRDAMQAAATTLQNTFTNNITVNVLVSYGVDNKGAAFPSGGITSVSSTSLSYSSLRQDLASEITSPLGQLAVASLPNAASLNGQSTFFITSAQQKAFGLVPANGSGQDAHVFIGSNMSSNATTLVALHELTHAMGRSNGGSLDLFRFNEDGSGTRVFGGSVPSAAAYFSFDGGATDAADFGISSDPGDFLNSSPTSPLTPLDAFDETTPGAASGLTAIDIGVMESLGYNVAPGATGGEFGELLFQNSNGQAAIWVMNYIHQMAGSLVGGNPGPSWHAKALADFNGDGSPDILWQNDNGQAAIWTMSDTSQTGGSPVGGNPGTAWHVKGAGDFDGDGKADILWQNDDGSVAIWTMNGLTQTGGGGVSNPGASWHVVGTGDFNGDGKADILFQNTDGQAAIWLMNGTSILSASPVGGNPGTTWHALAVGDMNGDGKSDIIWQNDNGQALVWTMNGLSQTASTFIGGNPGSSWHVIGAASLPGDAHADIAWQNDSGQVAMWSGFPTPLGTITGGNPGSAWRMVALGS